jgi:hypothetical protein
VVIRGEQFDIVVDCADPERLAEFRAEALGAANAVSVDSPQSNTR